MTGHALVAALLISAQFERLAKPPPVHTAPPLSASYERKIRQGRKKSERTRGGVAGEGTGQKAWSAINYKDSTTIIVYSHVSTHPLMAR
jgi:hypothetical protein